MGCVAGDSNKTGFICRGRRPLTGRWGCFCSPECAPPRGTLEGGNARWGALEPATIGLHVVVFHSFRLADSVIRPGGRHLPAAIPHSNCRQQSRRGLPGVSSAGRRCGVDRSIPGSCEGLLSQEVSIVDVGHAINCLPPCGLYGGRPRDPLRSEAL